jgi:3-oxoacyl-[acyl-carrier protein] reductase
MVVSNTQTDRPPRLQGKTAIISGASRGIGAAVARAFASEGARIGLLHYPSAAMRELAEGVVTTIRKQGGDAWAVAVDVTSADSVAAGVDEVVHKVGDVEIFVSNAADQSRKPWLEITEADWDRMLDVNIKGAWRCVRAVYPCMRRLGRGKIIIVSSNTVQHGWPNSLHYVSSKAALVGFTRSLSRQVGPDGICVNCVMPGAILTEHELEMGADQTALAQRMAQLQAIPRRGRPDDLGGLFVHLAAPESDFLTGQTVVIDGGWTYA